MADAGHSRAHVVLIVHYSNPLNIRVEHGVTFAECDNVLQHLEVYMIAMQSMFFKAACAKEALPLTSS